jgi:hypothetical protein
MRHRLNQKFLTLVAMKGLVVGYAQWVGALTVPINTPLSVRSSGLSPDLIRSATPLALFQQDIHQF